ncbi:hypothetical protein ACPJXG_20195 [Janthinobacterium sp. NFX145]|uniref:hypothetical protein n=1 Tax=Janthinobacterium sp. NFX145 TaxID=3415602 RepID=UPI003CC56918
MRERFNTLAIGVPAQQFLVRCHVSVERQVPVMTEFAVRLLQLTNRMDVDAFRTYFGLRGHEAQDLLDILRGEGLVEETEGTLSLTSYAVARFVGSDDGLPRFTKIAERQSRPIFELLSFSPLPRTSSSNYWDNTLDIDWSASGESFGHTIDNAQEAFHRHFHEIERLDKDDEHKRAFDVYKIDAITAGKRFNVPLPIHFDVDIEGGVEYSLEGLELLPPELKSKVVKLTADRVGKLPQLPDHFSEFVRVFDDEILARYLLNISKASNVATPTADAAQQLESHFNFSEYIHDVHGAKDGLFYDSNHSRALLGALYLEKNQARVIESLAVALRNFKSTGTAETIYPNEMFWVIPDSELWGRTDLIRLTVEGLRKTVETEWGEPVDFVAISSALQTDNQDKLKKRARLLLEAGFTDVLLGPTPSIAGRFELLILPGVYAAAMYHWKVPSSDVVSVPVGFATTEPGKLRKLLIFLQKTCTFKLHRAFYNIEELAGDAKLRIDEALASHFLYLNNFLDISSDSSRELE